MAAKIIAALIAVFWVTMWALLVRTELHPHGAALRQVPPEHVLRIMFNSEQSSGLALRANGEQIGHLDVRPHKRPEDGVNQVDFTGIAQLRFPSVPPQRASWTGSADLDQDLRLQRLRLVTRLREPAAQPGTEPQIEIHLEPNANRGSYIWRVANQVVDEQTFTLDEAGIRTLMDHLGIDPSLLGAIASRREKAKLDVTAQQSTLQIGPNRADTFLITVVQNGQTLLECHLSQFGQIVKVTTLVGWTLEPDGEALSPP